MSQDSTSVPPLLSAERIRVQFGSLRAVNDLCFHLEAGHLLGLVGPNGAGKTTLLRAIAGLQPLTCGRVRILGEDMRPGALAPLRHIGFTPDTPALYDELTVRDFLLFIAKSYGMDGSEVHERIQFWLEQVWLTGKSDHKIKALSRGMRQRIGIARTLLPNPNVILLDEPAAGLDPAGRAQFRQLLCSLRNQGKALIVSSHILADLNEYCTHIAIMAQGSILQYGSVAQIVGQVADERCRYTVVLARPVADAADRMAAIAGLTEIGIDGERITFEYHSDRQAAAALLARLVAVHLPVASFAPNRLDLEEAYLRAGIEQVD